ncbi:MAG TPA: aromatase/cyclase, partial [Gemmatimonadales bacterium]|nr:aromatase/cyclase [Gemmatimonadales bacterium]
GSNELQVVEQTLVVRAPAQRVFDTYLRAEGWPQIHSAILHTERTALTEGQDVVRVWALRGPDAVRDWRARRTIDREGLRVAFTNEPAQPGMADSGGEWSFRPQPDGTTLAAVRHEFSVVEGSPLPAESIVQNLRHHSGRQLAELADAAQRADELTHLTLSFEDTLHVNGHPEHAWKMLYEANKWPERLPHVTTLTMTEDTPGIQFFDMDTTTSDGKPHTTRSVRICQPHTLITYKQLRTPPLLTVHTGHWRFTPTPHGLTLGARHTVTINPTNLHLLGPHTTIQDARDYLRRVLSTNSLGNLRLAKTYAEEQAGH